MESQFWLFNHQRVAIVFYGLKNKKTRINSRIQQKPTTFTTINESATANFRNA